MDERDSKARTIFLGALEIASETKREAYVNSRCGDDNRLRAEVNELLQHEGEMGSFLESPAIDKDVTKEFPSSIERPGTRIGSYKLLQQIGEGGMGVVFMAEQTEPIRRKVALKIIKPGMDTKEVIARFEAERQALAMMDHPNIAKVLGAGATDSGRPYFVMDLVRGVPITDFCDQNQLSTENRLELLVTVCQAVQHAHQKGIIHRDLKPSNVLVTLHDGTPVVKVIDFGVAKAVNQQLTEKTLFTAFGQMVGTPQYMSPEQAEMSGLDVDTRSDIYSLGVLLYELLTGSTPLESKRLQSAGYAEMQRLIREEEPVKPSVCLSSCGEQLTAVAKHRSETPERLCRLIRGDLDWIVLRALAKDRTRRYETASNLSDDIRRHLSDEPVLARPDSAAYRLRKFTRKNKSAVVTAVLFGCVLLGATVTSSVFAWREYLQNQARQVALEQLQATLSDLKNELLDRAFSLALAGDIEGTEYALAKAEDAGAEQALIRTIRAVAYLHADEIDRAIALLNEALEDAPDDLATASSLTWANFVAGRHDQMAMSLERVGRAKKTGANDYAQILLAQATVWGTMDLPGLVQDLDVIVERHPRWGIAYAVRALAKSQIAQLNQSMADMEDAACDADKARQLLSDNPFVLNAGITVYTYLIQLARHQNMDATRFEAQAGSIADDMDHWPGDLAGRMHRLLYYHLVGETEKYNSEYQDLLKRKTGTPMPELAGLIEKPDRSEFEQFVKAHAEHPAAKIDLAIRYVIDGEEDKAFTLLGELEEKYTLPVFRLMMLNILQVARRPDLAKAFAVRTLDQLPQYGPPSFWRFEHFANQYEAGEIEKGQFLELAGPFHLESCMVHFEFGMQALSKGDRDGAIEHLQIASECAAPGMGITSSSKAYLNLIDQGLLPVQRSDSQ